MDSDEEKFENFLKNISVIIMRKIAFFKIYMKTLADEVGEVEAKHLDPDILKTLSSMDPQFFVSKKELEAGSIIASTELEDIDRKKIGEIISESLHF